MTQEYIRKETKLAADPEAIHLQIRSIVATVFKSAEKGIDKYRRKHCFEIFGIDVILDSGLNCWLLEVNSNPSLDSANEAAHQLKLRMVGIRT